MITMWSQANLSAFVDAWYEFIFRTRIDKRKKTAREGVEERAEVERKRKRERGKVGEKEAGKREDERKRDRG